MSYEEYFLNDKNISQFKNGNMEKPIPKPIENTTPAEKDKLFWCFFIALKGEVEYEHIKMFNKIEITEKMMKIEFVEKLNKQRKEINKKKLVKCLSPIEANLTEKFQLETLVVLAFMENLNILFLTDKSFFICTNDPTKDYSVISNNTIKTSTLLEVEELKKGKIERCKVNKILHSISYYKVNDLQEKYDVLVKEKKKMNKQQLYDEIEKFM